MKKKNSPIFTTGNCIEYISNKKDGPYLVLGREAIVQIVEMDCPISSTGRGAEETDGKKGTVQYLLLGGVYEQ